MEGKDNRRYKNSMFVDLFFEDEDAIKHAIEECIRQGILVNYLTKKGSEVINMLTAEYNYDLDIEVQREEAFSEGEEKGEAEFAKLTSVLLKQSKSEELLRAANDKAYRKELYRIYEI